MAGAHVYTVAQKPDFTGFGNIYLEKCEMGTVLISHFWIFWWGRGEWIWRINDRPAGSRGNFRHKYLAANLNGNDAGIGRSIKVP